jgi:truncated hemoglobin YjbI
MGADMIDKQGNTILPDFPELTRYAKMFSGLTEEKENVLRDFKQEVVPHLSQVTEDFYATLQKIPQALPFLEGRIDTLKQTHIKWMHEIFTGPYDERYTEEMYKVGDVHVRVNLPVEFMSGGIALISNELYKIIFELRREDIGGANQIVSAVNSIMGFSLLVMQKSYQASVDESLDKFLLITGMSKPLFEKLASTFNKKNSN